MEQESISNKSAAIIGAGPAGCACAYFLGQNGIKNITLFEKKKPLGTLLPTGGGKCNLANAQFDFRELAKNYPRGEKFLYSVFSQFSTQDTIDFFEKIGVKTYIREDNRIFPVSNSSEDVRKKLLASIKAKIVKEKVIDIAKPLKESGKFTIITERGKYLFDCVVIAIGGHAGLKLLKNLDIKTTEQTPALVGYITEEDFSQLAGVSINGLLFTHKGVSGPLIYKISSLRARKKFPYKITVQLARIDNLQELLNLNPQKEIKNIISGYIPKSLAEFILGADKNRKCHTINKEVRQRILDNIENFTFTVTGKVPDGEVVTCGGADLDGINSKTMEVKNIANLYLCGEILDIDGFCGGFNLQNCWSDAYIAAKAINGKIKA